MNKIITKIKQFLQQQGIIKPKIKNQDKLQYIYKQGNKYIITKTINGKTQYYGSYTLLEDAVNQREKLKKQWNKNKDDKPRHKYIAKQGDKYIILKQLNGKLRYFGTYTTLPEATQARDKLIKNGWIKK